MNKRVNLKKPKNFCGVLTSSRLHPAILSLKGLYCCYIYFHCSYMYTYYNYSQSMCIKLQNFNVSYPDLMQFHYIMNTIHLTLKEGFGGERRPEDRVPLWISVWAHVFQLFRLFYKNYVLGKRVIHVWE
jgi:hypothetical protein